MVIPGVNEVLDMRLSRERCINCPSYWKPPLFFTSCSLVPFADDTDFAEITLPSSFFQCKLHSNTLKDDDDGDERDKLSNLHLRRSRSHSYFLPDPNDISSIFFLLAR